MSLSKPIYSLLGTYFEQLFNHPVRTKSITSCVIATTANYTSQKISGENLNKNSLLAYGLFGLLFGGTVPHYFYLLVDKLFRGNNSFKKMCLFLAERFLYAPVFQVLSLYFLSRFEGYNHHNAINNLIKLYQSILHANWKYLSLPVFFNIYFVPSALRVLVANIIGFLWVIYLANRRRKAQTASAPKRTRTSSRN